MKIAVYHELPKGGARISVNLLSKVLKKKHQVDLYTLHSHENKFDEKEFFTNIYKFRFDEKKWVGNDWRTRLYKDTVEIVKLYFLNQKIGKIIYKRKYDIVFVHASKRIEAPFILRNKNLNTVYYLHDPYFRLVYENKINSLTNINFIKKSYEELFRLIIKKVERENVLKAKYVVANSSFTKKLFKKTYRRACEIVKLGIDLSFFKPAKSMKKYDLLYIGSKNKLDGYDTFLKIKNNLPKKIKIKEILFDNQWLPQEEIRKNYYESKYLLALSRNEPLGLSVLEASACLTPSIAVMEGGHRETIENDVTGILVKRDPEKIASRIKSLLKKDSAREKLIKKIPTYIKEWDIEKTAEKLEKMFHGFISK